MSDESDDQQSLNNQVITSSTAAGAALAAGSQAGNLDGFTHRYAEVNGTRIHYVIGGKGPAIVLLHGFPGSAAEGRIFVNGIRRQHRRTARRAARLVGRMGKPSSQAISIQSRLIKKIGNNPSVKAKMIII